MVKISKRKYACRRADTSLSSIQFFKVMRGRDVTNRNIFHLRGMNLELTDDGGKPPFPNLASLPPNELEYALRWRDRFQHKAERQTPIAVLREFWEAQPRELEGVYVDNTLSLLSPHK